MCDRYVNASRALPQFQIEFVQVTSTRVLNKFNKTFITREHNFKDVKNDRNGFEKSSGGLRMLVINCVEN